MKYSRNLQWKSKRKYLFSLYLIPIHDFIITFFVYLFLHGLVLLCLFFYFTACKYHSMMCTCIVVLVYSEPENSAFNPIIFPLKSCYPITHDAFKIQSFLVFFSHSLNQNLWKWFHVSEFLTSVLMILIF